jgi:hypothetical protein
MIQCRRVLFGVAFYPQVLVCSSRWVYLGASSKLGPPNSHIMGRPQIHRQHWPTSGLGVALRSVPAQSHRSNLWDL